MDKFWKQFKSGTDVRGVAVEGVEGQVYNLTDEVIEKITAGFLFWLSEKLRKPCAELTVAVGHDSRISAQRIKAVVLRSFSLAGVKAYDCGLSSTPSMFMTTVELGCDGAVQITASHHPYYRNGLKFFTRDGGLDGKDLDAVLNNAQEERFPESAETGTLETVDFMKIYAKGLRDLICKGVNADDYEHPLKGYKIVVDAGNGAGGFYAKDVLEPLGADITGSQFLEPDGYFPNHIPNPEDETAMQAVCRATVQAGADLGVIFDTDVDRGGCVDQRGGEINRNRLVALASAIALDGNQGGTVVTDSITSDGLKMFIEQDLGGKHRRFKRGYKNVINEAIRLNKEGVNSPLAIETSGHAAFRENYFLDDGAYLITKIIIKMALLGKQGKKLDNLIGALRQPKESAEVRMEITAEDFRTYGEMVIEKLEWYAQGQKGWTVAQDSCEGVRVSFDKDNGSGWFLLRLSVHDPIMPLNIESDVEGGVKIIAQKLYVFIQNCGGLESESLARQCK